MPVIRTEVEVHAPQEKVWQVVSDPRNLPRWYRHVVAVRGVPSGGLKSLVSSRLRSDDGRAVVEDRRDLPDLSTIVR